MSSRDAFEFVRRASREAELRDAIAGLGRDARAEDLVRVGADFGLAFTANELRDAFARDWKMRRAHYAGIDEPPSE